LNESPLNPSEYHPYYAGYIAAVGNIPLPDALENSLHDITTFISGIPEHKRNFAYASGKWSVAEVLVHLMDAERVFQYRALRFSRNDATELKGFEQDDYVPESRANERSLESIEEEFVAIRKSTMALFKSFDGECLRRSGMANGAGMSVRALGYVICGHQAHHFGILQERYMS